MEKNLEGKRLLLLGGNLWKGAIRQFADEQGITLVATSNDPHAGIFEIADETYLVSSTDADAMKCLIREKNIDGVYMGGSEPVISAACQYLNELNMPCYCTKEQWDYLQNKQNFKNLCISCGLPVVPRYEIDEADFDACAANIPYPVITKPVDGCGSAGFSVCQNAEELRFGYQKAKAASDSGNVLVEKFVKNDGVVVFYTLSNGEAVFSGLEDKYPVRYKETGSYVAGMHLFASEQTNDFRNRFEDNIKAMFRKLHLREGSVWIEVFFDGANYYFNEAGYRISGSISIYPVQFCCSINQVATDIYYALTGESIVFGFRSLLDEKKMEREKYAVYSLHIGKGKIGCIKGIDELRVRENVVAIPVTKHVGDTIAGSGTIGQVLAFVHFVYDTENELRQMLREIHETVKIMDTYGNNMLLQMINPDTLVVR